jgi:hypothetical protein
MILCARDIDPIYRSRIFIAPSPLEWLAKDRLANFLSDVADQ